MHTYEKLQTQYDELLARRWLWIHKYDNSPDGSKEKQAAVKMLNEISDQVHEVERLIGALWLGDDGP
jgi:hypothetical protein